MDLTAAGGGAARNQEALMAIGEASSQRGSAPQAGGEAPAEDPRGEEVGADEPDEEGAAHAEQAYTDGDLAGGGTAPSQGERSSRKRPDAPEAEDADRGASGKRIQAGADGDQVRRGPNGSQTAEHGNPDEECEGPTEGDPNPVNAGTRVGGAGDALVSGGKEGSCRGRRERSYQPYSERPARSAVLHASGKPGGGRALGRSRKGPCDPGKVAASYNPEAGGRSNAPGEDAGAELGTKRLSPERDRKKNASTAGKVNARKGLGASNPEGDGRINTEAPRELNTETEIGTSGEQKHNDGNGTRGTGKGAGAVQRGSKRVVRGGGGAPQQSRRRKKDNGHGEDGEPPSDPEAVLEALCRA